MPKPNEDSPRRVEALISFAASELQLSPDRKPWNYGWYVEDYRRSERAAMSSPDGPVSFTPLGFDAWEQAVVELLSDPRIRDRWNEEEFWSLVGSLTVAAKYADDRDDFIRRNLGALRSVGPALTILLIANVTWEGSPIALGKVVLGKADSEFVTAVNRTAGRRPRLDGVEADEWLQQQVAPRTGDPNSKPVAIASWSLGQAQMAHEEAERHLSNVIDLCLLLEKSLPAHNVYRRGPANRPGHRGLTLDRTAVEKGLTESARVELSSQPLTISELSGNSGATYWYGAEPLPLGALLGQRTLRSTVQACLKQDPLFDRIRLAARWFSESFYTTEDDDAALALGVAMDALLSGDQARPGGMMADRYALLEPDPQKRVGRIQDFQDLYKVRSTVAHGGRSSKLNARFIRRYEDAVRHTAYRMLALRERFEPNSMKELDSIFDRLRLGALMW